MKVLLVGKGGREHAIAWKLAQSPMVDELLVAPGNAGTAQIAVNVPIQAEDLDALLRFAQRERVDLTVVGPEAPLAAGIVDRFEEAGLAIFGPTRAAARIETSKSFAKELMLRHGVPTGKAETFDDYQLARGYVEACQVPVAVKSDGLTAGKGVTVCHTRAQAQDALRRMMLDKEFGASGERLLIEEYLEGPEVSVFAFVDGENMSQTVAATDYKRVGDGDVGPNTGGMGAYSPPSDSVWTDALERQVRSKIMDPVVAALRDEGNPYRGALYAGLMITHDGPKVIEFNCRLGDPETQVVLPRLKSDLAEIMLASVEGDVSRTSVEWDPRPCVGVVMASGGYPGAYETGYSIEGLASLDDGAYVFHAGSKSVSHNGVAEPDEAVTDGGRVLSVAALGNTLAEARERAYANTSRISFTGSFYRADIAKTVP